VLARDVLRGLPADIDVHVAIELGEYLTRRSDERPSLTTNHGRG